MKLKRLSQLSKGRKHFIYFAQAIIIVVCLGGCTPKHTSYSDFSKIATFGWDKNAPIVIKPIYPDSLATYDLYLAVRHSSEYKYQNLWLFIDYYNNCDSLVKRDTVQYKLANEFGKWYSNGFGSQYQYEELIDQQVTSDIAHHIVIWHGMRNDTLKQIQDIGIRLDIKNDI
ncbi:MAG: gliding motility lipoprotein GldH [Bacteroidales bacterium]